MHLCLYDEKQGYYMRHARVGRGGDFVTAPGLTPAFGACVGDWVKKQWEVLGKPARWAVVEIGAGEGDLMGGLWGDDIRMMGGQGWIVEVSPRLREVQQTKLAGLGLQWRDWEDLPHDMPLVVVANEVLDAFAVRQVRRVGEGWEERGFDVELNEVWKACAAPAPALLPEGWVPVEGAVVEVSAGQREWLVMLKNRLARQGGTVWLCDYGYRVLPPEGGDTVQAVKAMQQVGLTETPGETDLTAHVDFGRVAQWLGRGEVTDMGPWLLANGLLERGAEVLRQNDGEAVLRRLVHPAEMGGLFKVITATFDAGAAAL